MLSTYVSTFLFLFFFLLICVLNEGDESGQKKKKKSGRDRRGNGCKYRLLKEVIGRFLHKKFLLYIEKTSSSLFLYYLCSSTHHKYYNCARGKHYIHTYRGGK